MSTPSMSPLITRRALGAAALAALLLAAVGLARLGPAPAMPTFGSDPIPAVHQPSAGAADWRPVAPAPLTGDGAETRPSADPSSGTVEPDGATVRAGGSPGGVLGDRAGGALGGVTRAGGLNGGVVLRNNAGALPGGVVERD